MTITAVSYAATPVEYATGNGQPMAMFQGILTEVGGGMYDGMQRYTGHYRDFAEAVERVQALAKTHKATTGTHRAKVVLIPDKREPLAPELQELARSCARGHWQEGIVDHMARGYASISPASRVVGKARNWQYQYQASWHNLVDRLKEAGFYLDRYPGVKGGEYTATYILHHRSELEQQQSGPVCRLGAHVQGPWEVAI